MMALGSVLARVISPQHGPELRQQLHDQHFGVTSVKGEGRNGEVQVLFINLRRKRLPALLQIIRAADPDAFVTVDPVGMAIGGHLPVFPRATALKK